MSVWEFLKKQMESYGDCIAFTQGEITYDQLIKLVDSSSKSKRGTTVLAKGDSKQEQAIKILQIMASGNIPVPVELKYGIKREDEIKRILSSSHEDLSKTAAILFTSGTTGEPKGVKLSHNGIIENLKGISDYFNVSMGQKILISRPLVHVAVFTGEFLFALFKGLKIDFYEEDFQPYRLSKYIDDNKIEILGCTPTLIYHMSRFLEGKYLRDIVISGERLSKGVEETLRKKYFNLHLYNVYGLTENSPRVSALQPKDFFIKSGSVGKPIRHTRIKIKCGELLVKSKSLMLGYLGREKDTSDKLKGGWLHTGDMAKIDNDGYLYILGRKDDMIIRSGMNIYPTEIEGVAMQIEGVQNCVVYGIDDVRYGQKICMKVVTKISKSELRGKLVKMLPLYLVPDQILIVDKLDLTPSGKKIRK